MTNDNKRSLSGWDDERRIVLFYGSAFGHEYYLEFKPETGAFRILDNDMPEVREKIDAAVVDNECGSKSDKKEATPESTKTKKPALTISRLVKGGWGLLKSELGADAARPEVIEERKSTCLGCDQYDFGQCANCGCYLAAKIKIKGEECPLGYWGST